MAVIDDFVLALDEIPNLMSSLDHSDNKRRESIASKANTIIDQLNQLSSSDIPDVVCQISHNASVAKTKLSQLNSDQPLQKLFHSYDTNRNGSITYDEFNKVVNKSSAGLNSTEISQLAEIMDKHSNGSLAYADIIQDLNDIEVIGKSYTISKSSNSSRPSTPQRQRNDMKNIESIESKRLNHPPTVESERKNDAHNFNSSQQQGSESYSSKSVHFNNQMISSDLLQDDTTSALNSLKHYTTQLPYSYTGDDNSNTGSSKQKKNNLSHKSMNRQEEGEEVDGWYHHLQSSPITSTRFKSRRLSEGNLILSREKEQDWHYTMQVADRYACRPQQKYAVPFGTSMNYTPDRLNKTTDLSNYHPILDASVTQSRRHSLMSQTYDSSRVQSSASSSSSSPRTSPPRGLRVGYQPNNTLSYLLENTYDNPQEMKITQKNHENKRNSLRYQSRKDTVAPPYFAQDTLDTTNWNNTNNKTMGRKRSQSAPCRRLYSTTSSVNTAGDIIYSKENESSLSQTLKRISSTTNISQIAAADAPDMKSIRSTTSSKSNQSSKVSTVSTTELQKSKLLHRSQKALVTHLSEQTNMNQFRHMLNTLDSSKSGKLNYAEFKKSLLKTGLDLSSTAVKDLYDSMAVHESGLHSTWGESNNKLIHIEDFLSHITTMDNSTMYSNKSRSNTPTPTTQVRKSLSAAEEERVIRKFVHGTSKVDDSLKIFHDLSDSTSTQQKDLISMKQLQEGLHYTGVTLSTQELSHLDHKIKQLQASNQLSTYDNNQVNIKELQDILVQETNKLDDKYFENTANQHLNTNTRYTKTYQTSIPSQQLELHSEYKTTESSDVLKENKLVASKLKQYMKNNSSNIISMFQDTSSSTSDNSSQKNGTNAYQDIQTDQLQSKLHSSGLRLNPDDIQHLKNDLISSSTLSGKNRKEQVSLSAFCDANQLEMTGPSYKPELLPTQLSQYSSLGVFASSHQSTSKGHDTYATTMNHAPLITTTISDTGSKKMNYTAKTRHHTATDPSKFWALEHNQESKEMYIHPIKSFRPTDTKTIASLPKTKFRPLSSPSIFNSGVSDITESRTTALDHGINTFENTWNNDHIFNRSLGASGEMTRAFDFNFDKLNMSSTQTLGDTIRTQNLYSRSNPASPASIRTSVLPEMMTSSTSTVQNQQQQVSNSMNKGSNNNNDKLYIHVNQGKDYNNKNNNNKNTVNNNNNNNNNNKNTVNNNNNNNNNSDSALNRRHSWSSSNLKDFMRNATTISNSPIPTKGSKNIDVPNTIYPSQSTPNKSTSYITAGSPSMRSYMTSPAPYATDIY